MQFKMCVPLNLTQNEISCCLCSKSPAVISVTVVSPGQSEEFKSVWSVFLFLFTSGRPQCQRLVRGYGLANVRSTPCVVALSAC